MRWSPRRHERAPALRATGRFLLPPAARPAAPARGSAGGFCVPPRRKCGRAPSAASSSDPRAGSSAAPGVAATGCGPRSVVSPSGAAAASAAADFTSRRPRPATPTAHASVPTPTGPPGASSAPSRRAAPAIARRGARRRRHSGCALPAARSSSLVAAGARPSAAPMPAAPRMRPTARPRLTAAGRSCHARHACCVARQSRRARGSAISTARPAVRARPVRSAKPQRTMRPIGPARRGRCAGGSGRYARANPFCQRKSLSGMAGNASSAVPPWTAAHTTYLRSRRALTTSCRSAKEARTPGPMSSVRTANAMPSSGTCLANR